MKKTRIHFTLLYIIIFILLLNQTSILDNKDNKKTIIKNISETTQVTDFDKTIDELNTSHTAYATHIQMSKASLAQAISNAGVSTNEDDNFETIINNISNILSNSTNDATATSEQLLIGQTAYVNGEKVTGTMPNNGTVTETIDAGGSYTIPAGYHNGSGKVTATALSNQTPGTATANNITSGKTAWVNGQLITGNGLDISSKKCISLGTGTSFNLTAYTNYNKFTVDNNLILRVKSISISASGTDNDAYNRGYSYSGTLTPTLSYNPNTGIASVSNTSVQTSLKTFGNTGSIVTITAVCELLLYNN